MPAEIDFRDGVVYDLDRGTDDAAEAEVAVARIRQVIREQGLESAPLLVDLRESTGVSPDARRVYEQAVADDRLERIAFVTSSTFMRVAVNFVTRASGKAEKTRFFTTPDDAMTWLRS